jgi:hypothetical protein
MTMVVHIDKVDDSFVCRCDSPVDLGVAFILIGRMALRVPGMLRTPERELVQAAIDALVPSDIGPEVLLLRR